MKRCPPNRVNSSYGHGQPPCQGYYGGILYLGNRLNKLLSLLSLSAKSDYPSLSAGATPKSIPDRDAIGTNRPHSILKWRLKRVGDDLDRRFQGLDPLLSITGVGILFRMAEQISFYIRFDGIFAIR